MAKKRKRRLSVEERRARLAVKIIVAYYVALLGIVLLTVFTNVVEQWQELAMSFDWYRIVKWVMYGLPVILAFLYGLLFKPFMSGLRSVLIPIVVIHGLYSMAIFSLRIIYFEVLKEKSYNARMMDINVYKIKHRLLDRSKDGQIDAFEFGCLLDTDNFETGDYNVAASITQRGEEFPNSQIGRYRFQILEVEQKPLPLRFRINPQVFEPYYSSGNFEVNLQFYRILPVEKTGKLLMAFSRWSPFIRFTSWEGRDPEIEKAEVALDKLEAIETFVLMPLKLQEQQVFVTGYIEDYPVDEDGNGLYDYLVLKLPLKSKYAGPLFVQATLQSADYPLIYEGQVSLGKNTFEMVINADYIQEAAEEGPFEFKDFQLFNRNPQCPGGECKPMIKPYFKLYLDDYITNKYRLEQFEKL